MKTVKKLSLLSVVGGSVLIADNVFNIGNNNAHALNEGGIDNDDRKRRAGTLSAILYYLLNEELIANNDTYLTQENTLLTVPVAQGVLSNDSADTNATVSIVTDVQNGILTFAGDGSFTYLPDVNFTGTDSFVYELTTSGGQSVQATATIRINGVPDAVDDDFILDGSSPFLENVITNIVGGSDTIVDGAGVVAVDNELTALGGRISIQANGDFEYTPPANLGGQQDSFVYTLQDNDGDTDTATITWQVLPNITGTDTVSVQENAQLQNQFTLFTPGSLEHVEINTQLFSLAQLNSASLSNALNVPNTVRGTFSIIGFDQNTGILSYQYDPSGDHQDHSAANNSALPENISIELKDSSQTNVANGSLLINITDTNPIANADARNISEDTTDIVGNVVSASVTAGDNADIIVDPNPAPVTSVGFGEISNTVGALGSVLAGNYGSLSMSQTGIYTYTLDNTNGNVQGLKSGESITETFSYTITDGDGSTDHGALLITIDGAEDALPQIIVNDTNGALSADVSVIENLVLTSNNIAISSSAGLSATGTALSITNENSDLTELTLDQLRTLNSSPVVVNGNDGELTLTGFNTTTGILSYSYNPTGDERDHSAGDNSIIEQFDLQVTDNEGDQSAIETLDILIADTGPIANIDDPSISENGDNIIEGNAVFSTGATTGDAADTLIDTNATPVTGVSFGSASGIVGSDLDGNYGALNISSSGAYTYTLDNDNPIVKSLKNGDSLTESFSYTIEDGDGDSTSGSLRVSINGADDPAPVITIQDDNGAANGQSTVVQNQPAVLFDNITLSAQAGLADFSALQITNELNSTTTISLSQLTDLTANNIQIAGTDGTLTLTNFDSSTGKLSYSFASRSGAFDHSGGTEFIEEFTLVVQDTEGDSSSDTTLSILIDDAAPVAADDFRSIDEDTSAIAGNAVGSTNSAAGDNADTINDTNSTPVTGISFGASSGTLGTLLASNYGSFVISNTGVYTYTLDNTNSNVQGLKSGESLTETFRYTITDGDGSTDNGSLQITINGVEDDTPALVFNGNSGNNLYSTFEPAAFPNGQFSITASAGLKTNGSALEITPQDGDLTTITLAELENSSTTNIEISGDNGTLTINGYSSSTQVVSFIYEIIREGGGSTGRYNHNTQDPFIGDSFAFNVIDNEDDSSNQTIEFRLMDTAPTAAQDTASITEDATPSTVTGNILTNDTSGADTAISVSGINFSGAKTVGTPFATTYGSLDINSDGTYTYTLDNNNTDVQDIRNGESLVEVFNYTIVDTDGDTSSTSLTVTINGENEPPSVTIPNSGLATAGSDVSVVENATTTGTFTLNAESGFNIASALRITDEDNEVLTLSLAQLQGLNTNNQSTTGPDGTLTLTGYSASGASAQISYHFDPRGSFRDHSGGDNSVIDTFAITATDTANLSSPATNLDIHIADTVPTANDDNRTRNLGAGVTEGQTATAGNAVGFSSAATGDNQDTFIDPNVTPVTDIDFGSTDGTPGSNLASTYGTFNINNSGVYTYTLDNSNPAVQGLKSGEFLREEFVYTITDGDGDTDTATLTVDIDGVEDAAPTAAFNTTAVSGGFLYSSAENAGFPSGQLTLTASAGLLSSGTALQITPQGGSAVNIPLSTLQAASPSNTLDIVGSVGTLSINGVSVSGFNTTLSFTFEVAGVPGSFDHSGADPAQDFFDLLVTDNEGDTASTNVEFRLTDTAPTAAQDNASITEDATPNAVTGDITTNDTSGADTAISVSGINFSGAKTVGIPFASTYGSMDINSDGTYTYTLDNNNTDVQNIRNGESLVEVFNYTIVDTDGDTSSSNLTVQINGMDEPVSITIPNDALGQFNSDISVPENSTINGTFTINAQAGLIATGTALEVVNESFVFTNLTLSQLQSLSTTNVVTNTGNHGSLTLNNYDNTTGIVSYSYDPTGLSSDHSGGEDDIFETFFLVAIDASFNRSDTQSLDILITDTAPTAAADTPQIDENTITLTGNVISGGAPSTGLGVNSADTTGADTAISISQIAFMSNPATVGSPISSTYGSMDINSDGTYIYTLDNGNTSVNDLNNGDSLSEVFSYTIVDTDGDTSTTTVTVTINGVTD